MNFKGKRAIKLVHGLLKLEWSRNVSLKSHQIAVYGATLLVKIGGPWTWSMIGGSMDPVHERGSMDQVHILMDPVHGGGPWTRGPCFVLSPVNSLTKSTLHFLVPPSRLIFQFAKFQHDSIGSTYTKLHTRLTSKT